MSFSKGEAGAHRRRPGDVALGSGRQRRRRLCGGCLACSADCHLGAGQIAHCTPASATSEGIRTSIPRRCSPLAGGTQGRLAA